MGEAYSVSTGLDQGERKKERGGTGKERKEENERKEKSAPFSSSLWPESMSHMLCSRMTGVP